MDAHTEYSANSQYGEQPNQLFFELLSKIDLMLGNQIQNIIRWQPNIINYLVCAL